MCIAVPARLVAIEPTPLGVSLGTVEFEGATRRVRLDYLPDATAGEYVLVHMGFAVGRVDAAEARAVLDTLDEVDGRGAA